MNDQVEDKKAVKLDINSHEDNLFDFEQPQDIMYGKDARKRQGAGYQSDDDKQDDGDKESFKSSIISSGDSIADKIRGLTKKYEQEASGKINVTPEISATEKRRQRRIQKRMNDHDSNLRLKRMLTSVDERKNKMNDS